MYHLQEFERRLLIISVYSTYRAMQSILVTKFYLSMLLYTNKNDKFKLSTNYFLKIGIRKMSHQNVSTGCTFYQ